MKTFLVPSIFDSKLPVNPDWVEVTEFLRSAGFHKKLLSDNWRQSESFDLYPISDTSIDCIRCLHEDLANCYKSAFAFDENGREDRSKEYRLLREALFSKYEKIDEDILKRIYTNYLMEDR